MKKRIKINNYTRYETKKDRRGYFNKLYTYENKLILARFCPRYNRLKNFKETAILENKIENMYSPL